MRGKDKSPKKNRSTPPVGKTKRKKAKVLVNYISDNVRGVLTLNQLKELNYYQRSTGFLIPKMSFSKLVREIFSMFKSDFRIRIDALEVRLFSCYRGFVLYLSFIMTKLCVYYMGCPIPAYFKFNILYTRLREKF